jgi:hypothetical protein
MDKTREGAKEKRNYFKPQTPCDRLLMHSEVNDSIYRFRPWAVFGKVFEKYVYSGLREILDGLILELA